MEMRLIFCWSPGRCGTGYLAKMLQTIPGIVARHEPPPRFQADAPSKAAFWMLKKIPAIQSLHTPIYIETSHLFCGYLPSLLSLGVMPDIIQIRRRHRDVALSFWRRRSIPGRTKRGKAYLLHPSFSDWQEMTDYQLCYWHSREIEAQALTLKDQVDRWIVADFEDLVHGEGFSHIIEQLDLPDPMWKKYHSRQGWRVNGNPENYYKVFPDGDIEKQEQEIDRLMR